MSRLALVTGATGFLGGHVALHLKAKGWRVRLLARRRPALPTDDPLVRAEWVDGSLEDASSLHAACVDVDAVFHCAALVAFHPVAAKAARSANVDGTRLLLEAAEARGVKRFVHCSSVAALGLPTGDGVSDETFPYDWKERGVENLYGRTKREADVLVRSFVDAGRIDAVLVHPGTMIGPRDPKPSSGRLVLEAAKGKVLLAPAGVNTFADVRSVAEGMELAFERGGSGEGYILSGENLSYLAFFGRVARLSGRRPPRGLLPKPVALAGGLAGDLASFVLRKDLGIGLPTVTVSYLNHAYASDKAIRELGYRPSPLDGAIADCLADFRRRGLLPSTES